MNDNYGHLAGDAVLEGTSALLLSELRATDVAGRFGGEEFLAVLHRCDNEGAMVLAERWRSAIERANFSSADGCSIEVTISLGVAQYNPSLLSTDDLIEAADQAL